MLIVNFIQTRASQELVESFSDKQSQAAWFLIQLSKELAGLEAEANLTEVSNARYDALWLKYELGWSRFELLTHNNDANAFLADIGPKTFLSKRFEQYKQLEALLPQIQQGDEDAARRLRGEVASIYGAIIDFANRYFSIANPRYEQQKTNAQMMFLLQQVLFGGFLISFLIVIYIYYREAAHNRQLAMTDPLTGMNNRLALFTLLQGYLEQNQSFVLFLLDLNGFKKVNDTHGHLVGDKLLMAVGHRLAYLHSDQCRSFRVGGDEFAIIVRGACYEASQGIAEQVAEKFDSPVRIEKLKLFASISLGMACYPDDAAEPDELFRIADQRMYQMKSNIKAGC